MQIPSKIQHGDKVISTVYERINGIIDYLHASKLRKGSGIDVVESPSGIVLNLVQKPASTPQVLQPAGASGLTATVSGGTATVAISGSTALVIEPGANIQITGGTNGELIISATGGTAGTTGFPDYSNEIVPYSTVDISGATYSYAYPVWLIGNIGITPDSNNQMRGNLSLWVGNSPNQKRFSVLLMNGDFSDDSYMNQAGNFICVPIPANTPFYFVTSDDLNYFINELAIYGCN